MFFVIGFGVLDESRSCGWIRGVWSDPGVVTGSKYFWSDQSGCVESRCYGRIELVFKTRSDPGKIPSNSHSC